MIQEWYTDRSRITKLMFKKVIFRDSKISQRLFGNGFFNSLPQFRKLTLKRENDLIFKLSR